MALAVVNRAQRSDGKLLLFPLPLLATSHPWEMKLWMPMQQWMGWMTQILTAADRGRQSRDGWVSGCCSSGIDGTHIELTPSLKLHIQNFLQVSVFLPKYLFTLLPPLVCGM